MTSVDDGCMRCGGPRRGDEEGYICDRCAEALAGYGWTREPPIWLYELEPDEEPEALELRDADQLDFDCETGGTRPVQAERSEPSGQP